MRAGWLKGSICAIAIFVAAVLAATSAFAAKTQTFTGTVGDAVCGAKHTMEGDELACLRKCIQRGSKYDLVVGDKVYVLTLKDQATADALDKLASQQVKVKGEANGDTIEVQSVSAAD
jgi:hypothetical protein